MTAGGLSYALMAAVALGPEGTGRGRLEAAEAGSAYNVGGRGHRPDVRQPDGPDRLSQRGGGRRHGRRERRRPCWPASGSGCSGPHQRQRLSIPAVGHGGGRGGSAKVVELPGGPGTVGVTLVDSNDRAPSEEIVGGRDSPHRGGAGPSARRVTVTAAGEREVTVAAQVSPSPAEPGPEPFRDAFRAALAGYLHTPH